MRLFNAALIALLLSSAMVLADAHHTEIARIKRGADDPESFLKTDGKLVIMGTASIDKAKIILLPEIHDDPHSLTTQLMLIAREKAKGRSFLVLDESLTSLKRSMWDIFSQKTLEIIAATEHRRDNRHYVPQQFESALQNLANKFRNRDGDLNYVENANLWSLDQFANRVTPFYGWDTTDPATMAQRNAKMVESLDRALKQNDRILVMAGARHVPELEFMTSQRLLCEGSKFANMSHFFNGIERKHGPLPDLTNGIGATAPIYKYLADKPYAVVFNSALYGELDRIVAQFKSRLGSAGCLRLNK